jgi:hypothetical protein
MHDERSGPKSDAVDDSGFDRTGEKGGENSG